MYKRKFTTATLLNFLLLAALSTDMALAQSRITPYPDRGEKSGASVDSGQISAAVSGPNLRVSKTASVDGHEVCGVIRVTNSGGQAATLTGIVDSLEVHFPRDASSTLPAGSTRNWYKVADVPIPLPGPVAPGATTTIPYCFSLCLAADFAGANSMRNVVAVSVTNASGNVRTFTTRSASFPPPTLDCRACCLPNGDCIDTVPAECEAAGGLPQAADSDCATTQCIQACCLSTGICEDRSLSACRADDGEPLGLGTDCATADTTCRGACCGDNIELGCVDEFSVDECASSGGTYLGNDTNCATDDCPRGCCSAEGSCSHQRPSECLAAGGKPHDPGSTCADTLGCPFACCRSDGTCDDVVAPFCLHPSVRLGAGTECATAECPEFPGGCCSLEGSCSDQMPSECLAAGGKPHDPGSTCADTLGCPFACCRSDGTCDDVVAPFCLHPSVRLGAGTECATASCTQACCFGTDCQELLPGECTTQGGQPQGPGTGCPIFGPTPCDVFDP